MIEQHVTMLNTTRTGSLDFFAADRVRVGVDTIVAAVKKRLLFSKIRESHLETHGKLSNNSWETAQTDSSAVFVMPQAPKSAIK